MTPESKPDPLGPLLSIQCAALPPGRYFIGDPAYTVGASEWADAVKEYFGRSDQGILMNGLYRGRPFVAVPTAFGDGVYLDQEGHQYPVDSGFLGAIPARPGQKETNLVRLVEFEDPTMVSIGGHEIGKVSFGEIEIDTDPNGELKAEVGSFAN